MAYVLRYDIQLQIMARAGFPHWAVWAQRNTRFSTDFRAFLAGTPGMASAIATRCPLLLPACRLCSARPSFADYCSQQDTLRSQNAFRATCFNSLCRML